MTAYNFRQCFIEPILDGRKRQTIRAPRKRHARPGEEIRLYTGMRTQYCKLIASVRCLDVKPIAILFDADPRNEHVLVPGVTWQTLDHFARQDGFAAWAEFKAFWAEHHPGTNEFRGVLIRWQPLEPQEMVLGGD